MVKTRQMVLKNMDNGPSKVNIISKSISKKHSKTVKGKVQSDSIEEMLKLCRPITIRIRRYMPPANEGKV